MSQTEVTTLLGPPTGTPGFDSWDLVYALGPCGDCYMPIDNAWLAIRLDDDHVTEVRIIES